LPLNDNRLEISESTEPNITEKCNKSVDPKLTALIKSNNIDDLILYLETHHIKADVHGPSI